MSVQTINAKEVLYYDQIGTPVQFCLDGVWHDAVVINDYRTHDGVINVQFSDGTKAWCGDTRHSEFVRPLEAAKKWKVTISNTYEIETDGEYCGKCPQLHHQGVCLIFCWKKFPGNNQCEYDPEANKDWRIDACLEAVPL
jgi:hypothetical protein